jgi:hypothetical protein
VKAVSVVIFLAILGVAALALIGRMTGLAGQDRWSRPLIDESIRRGDVIVASLEHYKTRYGAYPDDLGKLVPEFQPEIQSPVAGNRKWRYNTFGDGSDYTLAFEDDSQYLPTAWRKPNYLKWAVDDK